MLLELVEDLRRSDRHDVGIAGHRPPAGLKSIAPPELDRIERKRRADLIDHHLKRGHGLHGPVAAHRARGDAARVEAIRCDVAFRGIVGAKRRVRGDGRHVGGKIGEAAAVQRVVSGESDDLACCAIDPDPRPHVEGVPLDSGLKLVEAVVGEPNGTIGKDHRRQCDVQRERRVVAPAEPAAAIGEVHVDVRRAEIRSRPRRAGTRPIPPPRRATARRRRARGSCRSTSYHPSPLSGSRNIGSTDWVSN